jgi:hypothetical protein
MCRIENLHIKFCKQSHRTAPAKIYFFFPPHIFLIQFFTQALAAHLQASQIPHTKIKACKRSAILPMLPSPPTTLNIFTKKVGQTEYKFFFCQNRQD